MSTIPLGGDPWSDSAPSNATDHYAVLTTEDELHNDATSTNERIHTCGSAASAAVARLFRRLLGPTSSPHALLQGTQDMTKAFRQVFLSDAMLKFCVIAVWYPEALEWVFFQLWSMPFGLAGAVLDFNRVSAFLVAAARRWLGIPVLGFCDDFKITEPRECAPSAESNFL